MMIPFAKKMKHCTVVVEGTKMRVRDVKVFWKTLLTMDMSYVF